MTLPSQARTSPRSLRRVITALLAVHLVLAFHICCTTGAGTVSAETRAEANAGGCCAGDPTTEDTTGKACHDSAGPCRCADGTIALPSTAPPPPVLFPAAVLSPALRPGDEILYFTVAALQAPVSIPPPRCALSAGPDPGRAPPHHS